MAKAPDADAVLRDALGSSSPSLVAAAAKRIGEDRREVLVRELAPAFTRLCAAKDPAKADPGCRARFAIATAMHAMDHWDPDVFVAGLRVVQVEGYAQKQGDRDDTAAPLRGLCGLAHAHFARPDALDVLAGLLADPERATRAAAAQALGDSGQRDATALLRFKLLIDDGEPEVLSRCVESLLVLARDDSQPFLVELLAAHDVRAEIAALALGNTRADGVLAPLVAWSGSAPPELRHRVGYLAIALVRSDAAIAHLATAIADGSARDAIAAAQALATFHEVPGVADRIRAAAADRDAALRHEIDALLV